MIDQSKFTIGFRKKCGSKTKVGVLRKWYFNFDDIDKIISKLSHKLTCVDELVLKEGTKIYPVYATKKASSNHNLVPNDAANYYRHFDVLILLHRGPSERERIQELVNDGRICVIIQRFDNSFELLGFHSGMIINTDDYSTHDNEATTTINISTPDNEEESTGIKLLNINENWINTHLPISEFTHEFTKEFT
ncbi:hypothetical protein [Empedobacter brevis]|uniref:hypothetical protein n=1 Tax=Empedobacter brevis TaxID=247 RepID=UPI0028A10EE7|nr:hypothetical protein [Empedobacter brevis]